MYKTPNANRTHIALVGKRNAGKSSLLNALVEQEISLVSPIKGTTTDPVNKAIELLPLGPVLFIDTAGLDDEGQLGSLRVEKSLKVLEKTDFAIFVMDAQDIDNDLLEKTKREFKRLNIPYIVAINKIDQISWEKRKEMEKVHSQCIFVSSKEGTNIHRLKEELITKIKKQEEDPPIVGDLVPYNGKVILVVPIDAEAPKGRIILPQVQVIRDCLDHGIKSYIVRDIELPSALEDLKDIDLVITDSQAFKKVDQMVSKEVKLTSFSIVFARYKGDLPTFVEGIKSIDQLPNHANILISESCTHSHSHEDIGRVKIPKLLNQYTQKQFNYHFNAGQNFPEDIENYDLVIHCGSCMVNRKTMENRIRICQEKNLPITNYGVLLAYLTGILDRTLEIFDLD
ncbi:[FeFe] hydrogenase H-cluster maturation GTPase HydF [Irregularibacter muris]|uniref:[FeFe] hydrogenase H-cluster maturation GTPase HydF n=1 Tax=Irregularibacter muris TaxID=1796619 RepID=A0AAE3HDW7_9FIRM|nr:[FeFe] hydrogenase H-cluster maturation GTPase HydF [Irregularibacter muris]MCR1897665.1 [FeFe] hydrogenase H-cluster maturation GTPase HydF [Irregularibacter muris]